MARLAHQNEDAAGGLGRWLLRSCSAMVVLTSVTHSLPAGRMKPVLCDNMQYHSITRQECKSRKSR